jgi:hypothetical protein
MLRELRRHLETHLEELALSTSTLKPGMVSKSKEGKVQTWVF